MESDFKEDNKKNVVLGLLGMTALVILMCFGCVKKVCLIKQNCLCLVGPSITLSLGLTPVTSILLECNTSSAYNSKCYRLVR